MSLVPSISANVPNPAEALIPTSFYIIIGVLIVMNLGVIITMLTFVFKAGMFVAETKLGIKDSKGTGVRAHLRIDKLEKVSND